jgi:hypothetical protein
VTILGFEQKIPSENHREKKKDKRKQAYYGEKSSPKVILLHQDLLRENKS